MANPNIKTSKFVDLNCAYCGTLFTRRLINIHTKTPCCSNTCKASLRWKTNPIKLPTTWNKGMKMSDEFKKKLSASHMGKLANEEHFAWKGDGVSYNGLHKWVNRKLEKPDTCSFCNQKGRIEWASISHNAKRDLSDYMALCSTCHRHYDRKAVL